VAGGGGSNLYREEHVGGPHPYKKIKGATFCQLFKYCDYANLIETNNGGKNE